LALPSENRFLDKFFTALEEDPHLRDAYFARFDPHFIPYSPEESRAALLISLTFYGGYRMRRRLTLAVPIIPNDIVLDIGPEMGTECFILAEVYRKVLVAEPEYQTAEILRELAKHYTTDDGHKASDILEIGRAGIIPPGSSKLTNCPGIPRGPVYYDARGAKDIGDVFGTHFAGRVFLNHLALMMPEEPKLKVLLASLVSYCSDKGCITWCDSVSELSEIARAYAAYQGYSTPDSHKCTLKEIERYVEELLPDFAVTFRISRKPHQLITIARHK